MSVRVPSPADYAGALVRFGGKIDKGGKIAKIRDDAQREPASGLRALKYLSFLRVKAGPSAVRTAGVTP